MPGFLLRNKFKIFLLIIVPIPLIILILLGFNLYTPRFKNQELQSRLSKITRQLAYLNIPSSLPEGYIEGQRQGINNSVIPRLQEAREALRLGNIKKAREIIANQKDGLEFSSRTALRRYPPNPNLNFNLDANNDGMVDYLEGVYTQVIEIERVLSKQ